MGTGQKRPKPGYIEGRNGGNTIDLSQTGEADRIAQTMREIGRAVSSPAANVSHEQPMVGAEHEPVPAEYQITAGKV